MNTFLSDFLIGISSYFDAFKLIKNKRLAYLFLFPIVLCTGLAIGAFAIRHEIIEWISSHLDQWVNFDAWPEWLQGTGKGFLHIALLVLTWYLFYRFQKYVVLILLSPVLAYASEKTEEALTGKKHPFSVMQFLKDMMRGMLIAIRNLFLEVVYTLLLLLVSLVPIFAPFTLLIGLIIGWYFFGYSMVDYHNERQKLSIRQGNQLIRRRKGLVIANGMVFEFIFVIPILGFIVAPILSAMAAAIAMENTKKISEHS